MEVIDLKLKGLKLIKPKVFYDNRGYFLETYQKTLYKEHGIEVDFVQDNHSFSQEGCIRGMHYQSTPGQAKLIRVCSGEIFDVAVDINPSSPTFGQWEGVYLNEKDHCQLFIPIGFAHGFCVTSPTAHVLYKVSSPYNPLTEKGFRYNDPEINIQWPGIKAIVSERDKNAPFFREMNFIGGHT